MQDRICLLLLTRCTVREHRVHSMLWNLLPVARQWVSVQHTSANTTFLELSAC